MTVRRRIPLYIAGFVVLALVALVAAPFLFRDRIVARVQAAINDAVDAHVQWGDIGLSLFHDFPNVTLRLDRLAVTGVGRFQGDTLASVPRFRLVLDLRSVLGALRGTAPVLVRSVELDRPDVRLVVLEDGTANWNILRESEQPAKETGRPLDLRLQGLELRGGSISLENRQTGLVARVGGLDESLRGDFRQQRFTLQTRTAADTVSLRFAGVPYLSRARLNVLADLDVDAGAKRVTIRKNEVRLNELLLALTGSLAAGPDSSFDVDVTFKAPRADFREILSLVPAVYTRDFANLQTSGTMSVSGWARGRYGPHAFPALAVQATVENGTFRYPDLPLPARDVALDVSITNPGGSVDSTVLDVRRFHVRVGSNPVDGALAVRTPVSDPDVALRLAGTLDLADLRRTVKLENVEQLAGTIVADARMHARVSDVNQRRYDRVSADGGVRVAGLVLRSRDVPHPVQIEEAALRLSPQHAELTSFRGKIGKSDVAASGFLDNLVGYLFHDEPLRGQAKVASEFVDLNEWRSDDETRAVPVPANLDVALDAAAKRVSYGTLDLRDARGSLRIEDRRVTLQDFTVAMLGGAVRLAGFYETTDPARPTFDLDLHATDVDVPSAVAGVATVRAFAPVALYAQGRASADVKLSGALGEDMMPVPSVLSGLGSLRTAGLALKDFPPMDRLADLLKVDLLRDPGFKDLRSSFEIRDGKLIVKPFDVHVGQVTMNVSGANGIDQSLDYALALQLPRAVLGGDANRAISELVAKTAGKAGLDLQAAEAVTLGVRLGGTIKQPTLAANLRETTGATAAAIRQAVTEAAGERVDSLKARADSAAAEAARRASAEAARVLAEAEQAAARIREQARTLAETVRAGGHARADSLASRAANPLARVAAQAAADKLRKETDARADQILHEANARADSLIAQARAKAAAVQPVR